jgi:hypothetical protein
MNKHGNMRMKRKTPKVLAIEELEEETIHAIAKSKMHSRYKHLDVLLERKQLK